MTHEPAGLVTVEELTHYPQECELVNGQIRMTTPSGAPHGSATARLTAVLAPFVYEHGLGDVFAAETGFILARDPDTVRGPDIGFVSAERIPADGFEGFVPLAPDLAVEVLSPDDRPGAMREKIGHYLVAGTRLVWVVDPIRRSVTVHAAGEPPHTIHEGDVLDGGEVVPGFRYEIARLFTPMPRRSPGGR